MSFQAELGFAGNNRPHALVVRSPRHSRDQTLDFVLYFLNYLDSKILKVSKLLLLV